MEPIHKWRKHVQRASLLLNLTHCLHSAHAGGNWSQWRQLTPGKASSLCDESGTAVEYKLAFFLLLLWGGMGILYGFGVQMETQGRIECGIFSTGLEVDDPGK